MPRGPSLPVRPRVNHQRYSLTDKDNDDTDAGALHILGLAQMPADKSTLDAAYKRRIKITHPDRQTTEASTEMTMKLIAARALLIRLQEESRVNKLLDSAMEAHSLSDDEGLDDSVDTHAHGGRNASPRGGGDEQLRQDEEE